LLAYQYAKKAGLQQCNSAFLLKNNKRYDVYYRKQITYLLNESRNNRMNRYLQQPRTLIVACAIFGAALLSIIFFFGATGTTRGPIEMLSALLIAAIALLFRALAIRSKQ